MQFALKVGEPGESLRKRLRRAAPYAPGLAVDLTLRCGLECGRLLSRADYLRRMEIG